MTKLNAYWDIAADSIAMLFKAAYEAIDFNDDKNITLISEAVAKHAEMIANTFTLRGGEEKEAYRFYSLCVDTIWFKQGFDKYEIKPVKDAFNKLPQ